MAKLEWDDCRERMAAELRAMADAVDAGAVYSLDRREEHHMRDVHDNWGHIARQKCTGETVTIVVRFDRCPVHDGARP